MRLSTTSAIGLLAIALFSAHGALAIDPPPPAEHAILGLYTTSEFNGTTQNFVNAAAGETVTLYVVLSYAIFGAVGGTEFTIATDPPGAFGTILVLEDTVLPYRAVMVTVAPDYGIGYGNPVLTLDHRVLLAQPITLLSTTPVALFLQPYSDASLPDAMVYNDWHNPADIRVAIPNSAGHSHTEPVFGVNRQVVATDGATWGKVKALFD